MTRALQTIDTTSPPVTFDPTQTLGKAVRGPWRLAILLILVFFVAGGVFAAQAQLATSVIGIGRVVAEGQRRTVQPHEIATVTAVHFREGDSVQQGEIVIQLDSSDVDLAIANTRHQLQAAAAREARLLAEQSNDSDIGLDHPSISEHRDDPDLERVLIAERTLFEDRRETRRSEEDILNQRILQLQAQLEGERTILASLRERQEIVATELTDYQSLVDKGFAPRPRLLALQREFAEVRGLVGEAQSAISELDERISETKLQISGLMTNFRQEVSEALPVVRGQRSDFEERLASLELAKDRRSLRASVDGRIINLIHTGPGPVVTPSEVVFEIVPLLDRVIVETSLRPADIDVIELGMSARVVFSALSLQDERETVGKLVSISPDVFVDENSKTEFYKATVEVPFELIERDLPNLELAVGMPSEVYFLSGEKTLLTYLTDPIHNVLNRGLRE